MSALQLTHRKFTLSLFLLLTSVMTGLGAGAGHGRLGLNYAEHMAVAFVCSGKNNATATAIAIALSTAGLGPLVAVPVATLPMFQVVLLVGYVHLADRLRAYFADQPTRLGHQNAM